MNINFSKSGFTLIELLVVIAIIGILSSVVLASVSSARQAAKEASIMRSLNSAQTQAELYHNNNSSYSGLCSDNKIQGIMSSLQGMSDGAACWEATNPAGSVVDDPQALANIDWGIGVNLDDIYYMGSPNGAGTFDSSRSYLDSGDGTPTWNQAKTSCASDGKRLPTASALRAIYGIDDTAPPGFSGAARWSVTESPTQSGEAYETGFIYGHVSHIPQSSENHFQCVQ